MKISPITLVLGEMESALEDYMERLNAANPGQQFEVEVHWKPLGQGKIMLRRGRGDSLASALADMFVDTDLTVKRELLKKYEEAVEKLRGEISALEGNHEGT